MRGFGRTLNYRQRALCGQLEQRCLRSAVVRQIPLQSERCKCASHNPPSGGKNTTSRLPGEQPGDWRKTSRPESGAISHSRARFAEESARGVDLGPRPERRRLQGALRQSEIAPCTCVLDRIRRPMTCQEIAREPPPRQDALPAKQDRSVYKKNTPPGWRGVWDSGRIKPWLHPFPLFFRHRGLRVQPCQPATYCLRPDRCPGS